MMMFASSRAVVPLGLMLLLLLVLVATPVLGQVFDRAILRPPVAEDNGNRASFEGFVNRRLTPLPVIGVRVCGSSCDEDGSPQDDNDTEHDRSISLPPERSESELESSPQ